MTTAIELCKKVAESLFDEDALSCYLDDPMDGYSFEDSIPYSTKNLSNDYYTVSCIKHYGGEGKGNSYYDIYEIVDKVENKTSLVMFHGDYNSWNGVEWDDNGPVFVKAVEKVVIDYEVIV